MPASPSPSRRRLGSLIVDPAPLRLDRDFRLLWVGQAVSTAGRMMTAIVLPYQVYVLTGDVLAVGALSLVQLLPILVFTLGGGAVADAVDRRRLLLGTQLGMTAVTVGLALVALVPAPPVAAIFALAFVAGGLVPWTSPRGHPRSPGWSRRSACRAPSPSTRSCSTPGRSWGRPSAGSCWRS